FIDSNLQSIRPLIACAVVKGLKVDDNFIKQMVQLQEKIGENYGRKRKEVGIGLYDFDIMKPPVYYKGFKDEEIEFVPIDWKVSMRPSEILVQHDKGKSYCHLLEGVKYFPIVIDSKNVVASMPPIINSQNTGKITASTKNLFIECTGFKWVTVSTALEAMCMALSDRGGKIQSCKIHFPKETDPYPAKLCNTPAFKTEKMSFTKELVERKTGLGLKDKEILDLLARARYNAEIKGEKITVEYPSYRTDIMHPVDVIEDILISYGFNKIVPNKVEMNVVGSQLKEAEYLDLVREGCAGLTLQEVLTYNMTAKQIQGINMLSPSEEFVEIANPVSNNYEILRKRISPQLLDFLAKNKNQEYPQRIFEVGTCLSINPSAENGIKQTNNLCVVLTHSNVNYTEIKSFFDSLCKYLGLKAEVKKHAFPFLGENAAQITIGDKNGYIGEVKKEVIDAFGLRKPVCVFEIEL
ncbi:MAG: phenylalanine--tRNA ligase subunit beta, partial [Candidatus Diapherotrites archaeon]|nr:phenylalanine--tRNA ligase subunit beta [Candidatus Diapherotrites archaeon]